MFNLYKFINMYTIITFFRVWILNLKGLDLFLKNAL